MTKPTGTNDLNSFELFVQRKKYKDSSYPLTSTTGAPTPFDLWYDKPLYGRINKKGQPIIVIEEKLKRIESAETDLFVLDFVADAFENFRNEILKMKDVMVVLESQIDKITSIQLCLEEKSYGSI